MDLSLYGSDSHGASLLVSSFAENMGSACASMIANIVVPQSYHSFNTVYFKESSKELWELL